MAKIKKAQIAEYAGLGLGAIAASKVSNIKLPINLPAPVQAAVPLILGIILAKRSGMVKSVGLGMVAVGIPKLIGSIAPNLGIGDNTADGAEISDYVIEGADNYALAGTQSGTSNYALAGLDSIDQPDHNIQFG